jgi:Flp pilus assembly protein TadG
MVEFALVLPLLLTLALGVLDFGKAFNYWIDETHLANEGARWAAVGRSPCSASLSLQECMVRQADTAELRSGAAVCILNPGAGGYTVGNPVQMKIQYRYQWLSWFPARLGLPTATLVSASATMRLETNYKPGSDVGTCS